MKIPRSDRDEMMAMLTEALYIVKINQCQRSHESIMTYKLISHPATTCKKYVLQIALFWCLY